MIVVRLVIYLVAILTPAVAIADLFGTECGGFINCRCQVREAIRGRLNQQNVAVRADGAHHIQVEGDCLGPAPVPSGVGGASALIDLPEAAVRGRTG